MIDAFAVLRAVPVGGHDHSPVRAAPGRGFVVLADVLLTGGIQ